MKPPLSRTGQDSVAGSRRGGRLAKNGDCRYPECGGRRFVRIGAPAIFKLPGGNPDPS